MPSSVDCEIYQVPLDESEEQVEETLSPVEKPQVRKKRVLTEAQKEKCRANLAKAREARAKIRENEKRIKERVDREYDSVGGKEEISSDDEQQEPIRLKSSARSKVKAKPQKEAKKSHRRRVYRSESETESDSYSEEEPEPKPRKRAPAKPRTKKVSERDKRLMILESKLDEIIGHSKKLAEKPRIRNTKTTTTIIQTPKDDQKPMNQDALKKAATKLLSMF